MRELPKPNINFSGHYGDCVSAKRNPGRSILQTQASAVITASVAYESKASVAQLYTLTPIFDRALHPSIFHNLKTLYDGQMTRKRGPGRIIYDQLRLAANGRCPLCSHGDPKTIDHYLTKKDFPEFSILPINLVPSCSDCNKKKFTHVAVGALDQYLHPYYDKIESYRWLEASLTYAVNNSPTIKFFIHKDLRMSNDIFSRMKFQFRQLGLNSLYSKQASNEISGMRPCLENLHAAGGKDEVRALLVSMASSKTQHDKNSWQAATYRCVSVDEQFCDIRWT